MQFDRRKRLESIRGRLILGTTTDIMRKKERVKIPAARSANSIASRAVSNVRKVTSPSHLKEEKNNQTITKIKIIFN